MNRIKLFSLSIFALSFFTTTAFANAELAEKSACAACHKADKKHVGPGYKEIADKYAKDKDAEAKLIEKVKKGGVGAWGQIPMPANSNIKDEDIKTLVKWVLASNQEKK